MPLGSPQTTFNNTIQIMKLIKASNKHTHGNHIFHVEILYPGLVLGQQDTGFYTIGRIDHANFKPPGLVPMHPHRDDEIFSYMRSGAMIHKDTTGKQEEVTATHMMMMNAGSGVQHEESAKEDVEMLQIFMRPSKNGLEPKVQFHDFENLYSMEKWRILAGNDASAPLELRVDTNIFDTRLSKGGTLQVPVSPDKNLNYLYCFNGSVTVDGIILEKGDSLVFKTTEVIKADVTSDLVLFQINDVAEYSDTGMFSGNQNFKA